MKEIEVAAAIIVTKENGEDRLLAVQRGYGDLIGKWEFPGGKLEPNETGRQAVVREIREELGVDIEVDSFLATIEYDYPTFHLKMHCYICSTTDTIKLTEHQAMKWCKKNELRDLDWCPADIQVVSLLDTCKYLP